MTRRERLERKVQKREEWAEGRRKKSAAAFESARKVADGIPLGQPILVGHHSEAHHRRDIERIDSGMRRGVASQDMAAHHESKAAGLQAQLDRSIYSDDPDAPEALQARIAELEAKRERMKLVNKLFKKGDACGLTALGLDLTQIKAKLAAAGPYWGSAPHLPYELSNLGGNISRLKERVKMVVDRQARSQRAEASESGVVIEGETYVRVTFADKPARAILDALKAAGFRWGAGSWVGERAKLPAEVQP